MTTPSSSADLEEAGRVAVAIACYNGARFLPELLDSVAAQTYPVAEVVCSDDASTDDTVKVLERYAESAPFPVRVVRQKENIGIIENFIAAFEAASGDYIAYCDQDDVWEDDKVASCMRILGDGKTSLVCHSSIITDEHLNETGTVYYDIAADLRLQFPSVSFRQHAWGHQMTFTRQVRDVLFQLYQDKRFAASSLGTCFDHGIPFASSLVGDLYFMRRPLLKFRRHALATSPAGKNEGSSDLKRFRDRLSARADRMHWRGDVLDAGLHALEGLDSAQISNKTASLKTYGVHKTLAVARARMALSNSLLLRISSFLSVSRKSLEEGFQPREFIIDLLTAFFGAADLKDAKGGGGA